MRRYTLEPRRKEQSRNKDIAETKMNFKIKRISYPSLLQKQHYLKALTFSGCYHSIINLILTDKILHQIKRGKKQNTHSNEDLTSTEFNAITISSILQVVLLHFRKYEVLCHSSQNVTHN